MYFYYRGMRRYLLGSEIVRRRKRDALNLQLLHHPEMNKSKKEEKKKRMKAAGMKKSDKKDGYARGGASGR
jgi:hypothetical protein